MILLLYESTKYKEQETVGLVGSLLQGCQLSIGELTL